MANWETISSLATAGGTLVLAVATFSAVKSSNRSARIAEQALQEQRRPLFVQSRNDDTSEKIMFGDQHWIRVEGSRGAAEYVDGIVYLVMSLRNIGAGIGVCQAWSVRPGLQRRVNDHVPEDEFRAQARDLYIPAGDIGLWQGAIRDASDPQHREIADAIARREPVAVELLYSDQVGEQRTISRFSLIPVGSEDGEDVRWAVSGNRHWYLDRAGPR
ncbi:MAG TPA: hypothetical protein VEF89_09080 [Solirubrobacteraceae bacterium]|nr:hypothetical protein [Solirubrobacteraceae bacterium]